jgi:hypothetical protein
MNRHSPADGTQESEAASATSPVATDDDDLVAMSHQFGRVQANHLAYQLNQSFAAAEACDSAVELFDAKLRTFEASWSNYKVCGCRTASTTFPSGKAAGLNGLHPCRLTQTLAKSSHTSCCKMFKNLWWY